MTKFELMAKESGAKEHSYALLSYPPKYMKEYLFSKTQLEKFAELVLEDFIKAKNKQLDLFI